VVAILQAISTGGSGGGGGGTAARNHRGQALSLPANTQATLVSFTAEDYKLRGFVVYGTTDHVAWVEVDGDPLDGIIARGNIAKVAQVMLPNPETYLSPTAIVVLKVRNENPNGNTGDFEGTLLGE
jgi:hypothetical protein